MTLTAYHAFGLHITDVVVKLAELAPAGESFRLIAYGARKLPPTAVIDGVINDPQLVAREIQQLIKNPTFGRLKTNFVVCSLPESRVFLKAITLPKFPKKQLKEAILWEARSLLPVPPEKAYYQEKIIEEREKEVEALIAATEKRLVDGYIDTLKLTRLTPIALDLECYATARTVKEQELAKRVLLQIHLGTKVTALTVLRYGQVWFSRALNTGVASLIQEMAKDLGVSINEAKSVLEKIGLGETVGKETLKTIALGISSTVKFYQEQVDEKGSRIEGIVFTGGYSNISGLIKRLGKLLPELPITIAKPRLSFTDLPSSVASLSPLLVSIGLALRGAHPARWESDINFLPETFVVKLEAQEAGSKTFRLMAIFGYIAAIVVFILGIAAWQLYRQTEGIQQALHQQKEVVETHSGRSLFPWVEKANEQLKLMRDLEELRLPFNLILKRIAKNVPEGVQLTKLTFSSKDELFRLSGTAFSRGHILAFSQRLRQDDAIKEIVIPLGSFNQETNAEFTIEFLIDPSKL